MGGGRTKRGFGPGFSPELYTWRRREWRVYNFGVRAKREQLKWFRGLLPESQGQDLASTVLYVPYSLKSGGGLKRACFLLAAARVARAESLQRFAKDQRCGANMAHVKQSRPDSGLGFQVEVLEIFQVVPSSQTNGFFPRAASSQEYAYLSLSRGRES